MCCSFLSFFLLPTKCLFICQPSFPWPRFWWAGAFSTGTNIILRLALSSKLFFFVTHDGIYFLGFDCQMIATSSTWFFFIPKRVLEDTLPIITATIKNYILIVIIYRGQKKQLKTIRRIILISTTRYSRYPKQKRKSHLYFPIKLSNCQLK